MQLPSIQEIRKSISALLQRFPIPVLISIIGTIIAISLVDNSSDHEIEEFKVKVLLCCLLALPLFISIKIWAESINVNLIKHGIASLLAFAFLLLFYFSIPDINNKRVMIRFIGLFAVMHLLLSCIPYLNNKSISSFWNYNRKLFLRLLESGFFSLVIFAGIALAILALDKLFGVDINEINYPRLFILIIGIFNTWYFLADYPKDFDEDITDPVYSRPLNIFCKYISIPIIGIYFIILYAFAIKIGIQWSWPQGWIAQLIIWFSILGILVYLLSYFLTRVEDSALAGWFKKGYFYALFPMSILLLMALWRRYSDYGITENRYVVALLGIWLAGISAYFIFSKKDNIKAIPVSLMIFILFALFSGPFNLFNFSANNQVNRLEQLLMDNQLLENGKVKKNHAFNDKEVLRKISSSITYLTRNDHEAKIYPWFDEVLDSMPNNAYPFLNAMELEYITSPNNRSNNETYFSFYSDDFVTLDISTYDYYGFYADNRIPSVNQPYGLAVIDHKINIRNQENEVLATFELEEYLNYLKGKQESPNRNNFKQEELMYTFENEAYLLLLIPRYINYSIIDHQNPQNFSMDASYFIKLK